MKKRKLSGVAVKKQKTNHAATGVIKINLSELFHIQDQKFLEQGCRHAFFGKELDCKKGEGRELSVEKLKSHTGLADILIPNQNHTDRFVCIYEPEDITALQQYDEDYDAIILHDPQQFNKLALGVITADCLPVLIFAEEACAVIHAGWQGLANQITSKVLMEMAKTSQEFRLLIGPCAHVDDYEFKAEDLDKIGSHVVVKKKSEKIYLDLAGTLRAELSLYGYAEQCDIRYIPVSTMSDQRFFSYRNEGQAAGRNLSLLFV